MKKTVIKFATAQSPRVTLVCSRVTKYVEVDIYFIKLWKVRIEGYVQYTYRWKVDNNINDF